MKHNRKQNNIKHFANIKDLIVISSLVITTLVACGKKDDGPRAAATPPPPPVVNPFVNPNCTNCFSGTLMLSGVQTSSSSGNFKVGFDLLASSSTTGAVANPNNPYPNGPYPNNQYPNSPYPNGQMPNMNYNNNMAYDFNNSRLAAIYSGMVMLQGNLVIANAGDFMVCNATPGTYTVQTASAASYSGGRLGEMRLEANLPTGGRIIMRVSSGTFYNSSTGLDKNSQDNRVGLNMYLESVNGQPCGELSTY